LHPKRPRGRPRIFDDTRRQALCTLISAGISRNEACRQVGVPPSSVVHAARTDPAFAELLRQAKIRRANRPPELADIGSRSWRAIARRLEARSPCFRLPRSRPKDPLDDPRLHRRIRRIVRKLLRERLPVAAASSRRGSIPDYCSENPPLLRAPTDTKTIIAAPVGIIVSKPP
jgi:hypothetical protein